LITQGGHIHPDLNTGPRSCVSEYEFQIVLATLFTDPFFISVCITGIYTIYN